MASASPWPSWSVFDRRMTREERGMNFARLPSCSAMKNSSLKNRCKMGILADASLWMTYRDSGRSVGAVIMEAPSLIQPGLKAIRGVGAGATFAEGHELSADQAALVPAGKIGRMLATDEAERLLTKLKVGNNGDRWY
jgi:hypothetical protein